MSSAHAAARIDRLKTMTSSRANTGWSGARLAAGRPSSMLAASRTPPMLRCTEAGGPRIGIIGLASS
jgi:hypothetical protein